MLYPKLCKKDEEAQRNLLYVHTYVRMYACLYVCACVCVYVRVYVGMYITVTLVYPSTDVQCCLIYSIRYINVLRVSDLQCEKRLFCSIP